MRLSRPLIILGVLLLSVTAGWWLYHLSAGHQSDAPAAVTPPPVVVASPVTGGSNRLKQIRTDLAGIQGGREATMVLDDLRRYLESLPKAEAVRCIRQFLDGLEDVDTHLEFRLQPGGWLAGAPTLRTFLLDELGRFDPQAAAGYTRTETVGGRMGRGIAESAAGWGG